MEFITHAFRFADVILNTNPKYLEEYNEIVSVIDSISDNDLKAAYYSKKAQIIDPGDTKFVKNQELTFIEVKEENNKVISDGKNAARYNSPTKSLSPFINSIIKERMLEKGWIAEPPIFDDEEYLKNPDTGREITMFRLDFAKNQISVEVGFNHTGDVAHNLIKPVLASELNHVKKAITTKIAIIITATKNMKKAGGFDGAIAPMETYVRYLKPYRNFLTAPILIIGLEPPKTFRVDSDKKSRTYKDIIDL